MGENTVSNEEILTEVWTQILAKSWLPEVLTAAARNLEISTSTLTRRFQGPANKDLERSLIDWALDPDGQVDKNFAKVLAAQMVGHMADQPDVATAIEACARLNWEFVSTDDRMFMQTLLWSHIGDDRNLQARLHGHYVAYDQVHRVLWQDILIHLRERTGRNVLQRPGLTDEQLIIILDAMVEGFMLRWKADPKLPIADLYTSAFQALVASALDFDADMQSISEHLQARSGETID